MRHDSHYVEELATATRTIGKKISLDLIEPNPNQPRVEIGDLSELSASIKEKGVLEPLLVKPNKEQGTWMIIAGERRWRASRLAGLTEVPCIEMDIDEKGIAEIALIENLQRKDLTIWEEADGLAALKEKFGYTQEEIAKKISKSRSTVTELMTIAGLPAELRDKCRGANINSKATLLDIARQFDEPSMFEYFDRLTSGDKTKPPATANPVKPENSFKPALISATTFRYEPEAGNFSIEVRFTDSADLTKLGVLNAFKQAFDDVKNGRSEFI